MCIGETVFSLLTDLLPFQISLRHVAGLTTIASSLGPAETIDRVENAVRKKGLTISSRIQTGQTAGIDLPLKVLVS
jgi:hypothetical protein